MILVVGGSGLLGRQVVADLCAHGLAVRVLVRDAARAQALLAAEVGGRPPDPVEIVAGDIRQPGTLAAACDGATVVVAAAHGFLGGWGAGPDEVDRAGNGHLVDAAVAAGADVVLASVLGAAPDSPAELFRAKYAAERHLINSGAGWTVVRAGAFLETWQQVLRETAGRSGRPLVLGRGSRPIAFVPVTDVAGVVSLAVTDPTLRGQVLEIGGEPTTMEQLARAVQREQGWPGSPRHVPRGLLRAVATLARPVSPRLARQNRTALLMDTTDLGRGDQGLRDRLGLPSAP